MNEPPELIEKLRQWVEKAEEDYTVARHLLGAPEVAAFGVICFHAQQCAEKYLKALLTLQDVTFPKTHSLRLLLELLPPGTNAGGQPQEIVPLSGYGAEFRYPADGERVTEEEAKNAVAVAAKVREAARAQLPAGALTQG